MFRMKLNKFQSCFDIWRRETKASKIITRIQDLDKYLNGGINLKKITEFCGIPGSGKTQMCLQLCLNVQIPAGFGGLGGAAFYMDTKQDFHPERLKELATHMERRFATHATTFVLQSMLQNVHYVYCSSFAKLIAQILQLPRYLKKLSNIKLVIIDSLSFPLRMIEDVSERTTLLSETLEDLRSLTRNYDVAIVLTNEMTRKLRGKHLTLVPSLGETYAHLINERILVANSYDDNFIAAAGKSLETSRPIGKFKILPSGLSGITSELEL